MNKAELTAGLEALGRLVDGLESLLADPCAIARMDRAAEKDPTLLMGPTLAEYLGLDRPSILDSIPGEDS